MIRLRLQRLSILKSMAQVCVYASAYRLRGNTFRIKIVDEAGCQVDPRMLNIQ